MNQREIETVARSLYEAQENARGWEREPERLKVAFREHVRSAIGMLDEAASTLTQQPIRALRVHGPLERAGERFLHSAEVSIVPMSTFRTVLSGPAHAFAFANLDYYKLVNHRELINIPLREALPELKGQGYYELLDHVYATGKPFAGSLLPLRLQPRPGAPMEDHLIDLTYRPIENERGEILGLFVEGRDRTEWARA